MTTASNGRAGSQPTTSVNRVDGPAKVTGSARYSGDHPVKDVAYGYLVLSTIAKGTVQAMRVSAAREAPGVLAVYTPFDPLAYAGPWEQGPGFGAFGPQRFPLQPEDREVRHHGQVVGMVVAESFEQARDAAALIETTYDEQPARTSFTDGIADAVVPPPGFAGPPTLDHLEPEFESIDDALAAGEVTVAASYSQRPEHHNAMEPHSAIAEWGADGGLRIYSGTQGPLLHALEVAAALGIEADQVRVVSPYVGGAFGGKATTWAPTVLAAAAAREVERPVKLVLPREQLFSVTGHRPAVVQTVSLGAARDGTMRALKHECVSSMSATGAYYTSGGHYSVEIYQVPNLHAGTRAVTLDVPAPTIMRAPNEETGSFALECAIDELAYELGVDPVELRLRNDSRQHPISGRPYSGKHLDECLRTGAARFGWARRAADPRSRVDGEWLYGTGTAIGVYRALRFEMSMRVAFRDDGTVSVGTATADPGTGMWTVLAVVAADALGLPVDRIRPALGRSVLSPIDEASFGEISGAVASAGSSSCGPAVQAASAAASQALVRHAVEHPRSPFHGLAPDEVRYRDGRLEAAGRGVDFARLLRATDTEVVETRASSAPGDEAREYAMSSFAAHFCEVRVNRFTGEARAQRMMTVADAGRVLNVAAARNQIAGGVVWGLSQALLEGAEVEPSTGRIANANFADYLVPVNADVPVVEVHFLAYPDTIFNPVGSRGIGELGTVGSAAAVANAVFHATGKRIRDLPITPDKLLD